METLTPGPDDQEEPQQDGELSPVSGNRRLSSPFTVRIAYLTLLVSFLTPIMVALIDKI
jgi:hypothetical protein